VTSPYQQLLCTSCARSCTCTQAPARVHVCANVARRSITREPNVTQMRARTCTHTHTHTSILTRARAHTCTEGRGDKYHYARGGAAGSESDVTVSLQAVLVVARSILLEPVAKRAVLHTSRSRLCPFCDRITSSRISVLHPPPHHVTENISVLHQPRRHITVSHQCTTPTIAPYKNITANIKTC
jgi:hypothetical protein